MNEAAFTPALLRRGQRSAPGPIATSAGVDLEAATQLGVKVIWALSLPGKVAPVTSGRIIRDTIFNILNELGV